MLSPLFHFTKQAELDTKYPVPLTEFYSLKYGTTHHLDF